MIITKDTRPIERHRSADKGKPVGPCSFELPGTTRRQSLDNKGKLVGSPRFDPSTHERWISLSGFGSTKKASQSAIRRGCRRICRRLFNL